MISKSAFSPSQSTPALMFGRNSQNAFLEGITNNAREAYQPRTSGINRGAAEELWNNLRKIRDYDEDTRTLLINHMAYQVGAAQPQLVNTHNERLTALNIKEADVQNQALLALKSNDVGAFISLLESIKECYGYEYHDTDTNTKRMTVFVNALRSALTEYAQEHSSQAITDVRPDTFEKTHRESEKTHRGSRFQLGLNSFRDQPPIG